MIDEADDYRDRYVAYLDLLGFKSQVNAAEDDPQKRGQIREILHLVRDTLCENPRIGMRLTYFSDCMVVSADRTKEGLAEILISICTLTQNFLQHDILMRGGLTAGGAHHGSNFVYGTAVNRAYILESEKAVNPITLVSAEVIADAIKYGDNFMSFLPTDGPDRHFIDYLRSYAMYRPKPIYAGMVILDTPAARIVNFMCQRLNTNSGRALQKAEWLSGYWNETVATFGVFEKIEVGVPEKFDLGGPAIMVRRIVG